MFSEIHRFYSGQVSRDLVKTIKRTGPQPIFEVWNKQVSPVKTGKTVVHAQTTGEIAAITTAMDSVLRGNVKGCLDVLATRLVRVNRGVESGKMHYAAGLDLSAKNANQSWACPASFESVLGEIAETEAKAHRSDETSASKR